ncbi:hypothetical protein DMN91_005278 [Ooceraea biroi]|uniref:Uncharacterized protein n=1 Tax=Ooceraea biroi TaxID=2015173 RepID=A0A3L8DRF6_OOCBI|nr:hypothetical protein DMN91_005278 [Ooceraea biroi]
MRVTGRRICRAKCLDAADDEESGREERNGEAEVTGNGLYEGRRRSRCSGKKSASRSSGRFAMRFKSCHTPAVARLASRRNEYFRSALSMKHLVVRSCSRPPRNLSGFSLFVGSRAESGASGFRLSCTTVRRTSGQAWLHPGYPALPAAWQPRKIVVAMASGEVKRGTGSRRGIACGISETSE